jgi:hypothetical protein
MQPRLRTHSLLHPKSCGENLKLWNSLLKGERRKQRKRASVRVDGAGPGSVARMSSSVSRRAGGPGRRDTAMPMRAGACQ